MTRDLTLTIHNFVNSGVNINLKNNNKFVVENIENLTWGSYEIAATTNPFLDGDMVQNAKATPRDIEFTLKPTQGKGDYDDVIHELSRGINKNCTLSWKKKVSGTEETWTIDGIMQEFEVERYSEDTRIKFTLHCSNPFWKGRTVTLSFVGGANWVDNAGTGAVNTGVSGDIPAQFYLSASMGNIVIGDKVVLRYTAYSGSDVHLTEFTATKARAELFQLNTIKGERMFRTGNTGAWAEAFTAFSVNNKINGTEEKDSANPFIALANLGGGMTVSIDYYNSTTQKYKPMAGSLSYTEAWL